MPNEIISYNIDKLIAKNGEIDFDSKEKLHRDIRCVVLHCGLPTYFYYEDIKHILYRYNKNFHFYIDKDGKLYKGVRWPYKASHVDPHYYSEQAIQQYYPYCSPIYSEKDKTRGLNIDDVSLSIFTAIDQNNLISNETEDTLIHLLATLFIREDRLNLRNPMLDIHSHHFFTLETTCHSYFSSDGKRMVKLRTDVLSLLKEHRTNPNVIRKIKKAQSISI